MEEKDKIKILKRIINVCWFSLILCVLIKLFGGNYFDIIAKNQTFVKVCDWLETNLISTIIMYGFYCLNITIIIAIISKIPIKNKIYLLLLPAIVGMCFIKGINPMIGYFIELLFIIAVPLFISKSSKKKTLIGFIFSYILINVFQITSLFIRNIGAHLIDSNFCVNLIFQIDYYIMLVLYYLYSVKLKGENK